MSQLLFSQAPHLHTSDSHTKRIWFWNISLLPMGIAALASFGGPALVIMLTSVVGAALGEVCGKFVFRKKFVLPTGRFVYLGLVFAFLVTSNVSPAVVLVSMFLATILAQECFGGLGASIFHPSLVAFSFSRIFLMLVGDSTPTGNTFLFELAENVDIRLNPSDFLWGARSGTLGEASLLMTFAGAGILFARRIVSPNPSVIFLGSAFTACLLLRTSPTTEFLVGATFLISFFILPDYETSPINRYAKYVYALMCGFTLIMLRHWSGRPDSAWYGLLILNGFTPLLDLWIGCRGGVTPPLRSKEAGSLA